GRRRLGDRPAGRQPATAPTPRRGPARAALSARVRSARVDGRRALQPRDRGKARGQRASCREARDEHLLQARPAARRGRPPRRATAGGSQSSPSCGAERNEPRARGASTTSRLAASALSRVRPHGWSAAVALSALLFALVVVALGVGWLASHRSRTTTYTYSG